MAHVKVIVGALLACAICAQAFPAGDDSSSIGVNRPLPGAFLPSDTTNRPSALPAITPGVTPSRPVRDAEPDSNESKESKESHELASAPATTAKAPARRDTPTTTGPKTDGPLVPIRPLQGIPTTQSSHTVVRREDSPLRAGTNKPAASTTVSSSSTTSSSKLATTESSSQKNRRDATSTTARPVRPLPAVVPSKPTRQVTSTPVAASTSARPQPVRPISATSSTPAGTRTKRQVSSGNSNPSSSGFPSASSSGFPSASNSGFPSSSNSGFSSGSNSGFSSGSNSGFPNTPTTNRYPNLSSGGSSFSNSPSNGGSSSGGFNSPSSGALPTGRPLPSRPLPVRQVTGSPPTPARPLPLRPLASTENPAGSRTKRDDEVFYKPLDLQNPSGFPSFGTQPSTSEFSGVQTSFSLNNPQQPGVQTFGGITHGTISRPDGTSSVSLSSLSSSSSRSRRDDEEDDAGEDEV